MLLFYFPMIIWAGLIELAQEEIRPAQAIVANKGPGTGECRLPR
jgi:hypothetical protein